MVLTSLLLIAGLIGQASEISPGHVPYEISMKNGDVIFAHVKPSDLNGNKYKIQVILDEPWKRMSERRQEIVRIDIDVNESRRQSDAVRRNRLKRSWEANGGTLVDTSQGPQWVLESEVALAKRARDMANDEASAPVAVEGVPLDVSTGNEQPLASPGFLASWGLHIAVAGASLVGLGLIGWWGFFRADWSSL